jgi:hypothetical protein
MASDRQIVANRRNAKKSTGPRSEAARGRLRLNALRHGLAIPVSTDPAIRENIAKLAEVLSLSAGEPIVSENARDAAAAELDLLRIRKFRAVQFETYLANGATPDSLVELNDNLARFERYERRAFSRRKRALRALGAQTRQATR